MTEQKAADYKAALPAMGNLEDIGKPKSNIKKGRPTGSTNKGVFEQIVERKPREGTSIRVNMDLWKKFQNHCNLMRTGKGRKVFTADVIELKAFEEVHQITAEVFLKETNPELHKEYIEWRNKKIEEITD